MLKQFLPSLSRGVYRFNQQLANYLKDGNAERFVETKQAFLPRKYRDAIEKLIEFSDDEASILKNSLPKLDGQGANTQRANQFFLQHPCLATQNDNNYLEREFIRLIFARIFSLDDLSIWVVPQFSVLNYRLDFAVFGDDSYAIEVDGFGKFKQRADSDGFLRRQNDITEEGWRVYRYSYADVVENTAATLQKLTAIFAKDEILANIIRNAPAKAQASLFDFDDDAAILLCDVVDDFYAIQDLFIDKIETLGQPSISIDDELGYDFSLSALALSNLYEWYDAIFKVFDVDYPLPSVTIKLRKGDKANNRLLHPKIKFSARIQAADIVVDESALQQAMGPVLSLGEQDKPVSFRQDDTGNPVQAVRTKLGYFAQSIFGYKGIRYEQDEIFAKILSNNDVIGLLPTGRGKSFCFWLPAIIKPGLTLVISPLRALMRDQDISLKGFGIFSTAFINVDVEKYQRQAIYNDIKLGRVRLLYISPERMQIKSFITELDEIMQFVPVNFLVIDEAHCVSEWGHDFRPCYLRIPQFAEKIRSIYPSMTLIALTATAGELVKKDMMRILGLSKSNIVSATDFDRRNLSLQFITVDSYTKKAEEYKKVLKYYLPTSLHKRDINRVFKHEQSQEKGVGLIFCIYADSHGKHAINDSVGHYLRETQRLIEGNNKPDIRDFSEGRIRGFSSKTPTLCPKCSSSEYIAKSKNGINDDFEYIEIEDEDDNDELPSSDKKQLAKKICTKCNHSFSLHQAVEPKNWEQTLRRNQEHFKSGEIDVMVTTKGFGMGIDKSSVRFVVHTAMPSGLEGWYQEAGRAGRDREPAHCLTIVDVPNKACIDAMGISDNPIPSCTQKCPHGKQGLCDYGKRHNFIQRSYPSIEADTMAMLLRLDSLILEHEQGVSPILLSTSFNYQNKFELALYRLQVLGVIHDYTIEYKQGGVVFEVIGFSDDICEFSIKNKLQDYLEKHDRKNVTVE